MSQRVGPAVVVRLTDEQKSRLAYICSVNGRNMGEEIRIRLQHSLDNVPSLEWKFTTVAYEAKEPE